MHLSPHDYMRIQAQLDLQCKRCGICCIDTDPIDLLPKDIRRLASYLMITEKMVLETYTIPHPTNPDHLALKGSLPCRFYDQNQRGCKIYPARPIVCRLWPFLSPEQMGLPSIKVYRACLASKEGVKRIENINRPSDPDAKTRKRLEKALSKILSIE